VERRKSLVIPVKLEVWCTGLQWVFRGTFPSKGRIFIPAKLREELGEIFYMTVSMERCLCVYSAESWQSFSDKVNAMPYVRQRRMRPLFAQAAKCELDAQGRILIPQNLREYAGLIKNVTVVGCNNHAEFWDSAAWSELNAVETTPENIAAVMEELEF
jgi:MraZ protein